MVSVKGRKGSSDGGVGGGREEVEQERSQLAPRALYWGFLNPSLVVCFSQFGNRTL